MAGPERIEWRRSFPSRALGTLAWYLVSATLAVLLVRALFGDEPETQSSGAHNPLADLPMWTAGLAAVGAVPVVLGVLRRPRVGANHFALTVRPGWVRTLVLPWSRVGEVAAIEAGGERFLAVRLLEGLDRTGSNPGWIDKNVLRELAKVSERQVRGVAVAARLRDFNGSPDGQLAALAAFAPDQVQIANRL
ncbi:MULTISPECIES: hypothetical protein [Dactylosporangium]|uniref:Uncharacterized protein n=2 Tax=Dactylosporangium TaxID=35753 RepID=A0A9W6KB54_9ACTN|nr:MULTISPECIES: hypothetical protein [Dactylosporangium]UAB96884.1 hypothetical protein Dvina_01230 [Dactylosporangium vinaceum]UWZ45219.1 hypothetical protein Dmats_01275 [Dactylosporangium matsuzakiense]GLK98816.1 hypothetical protein GCM10017581_005570 [Dactylosporangium matsuzakiense]